MQGNLSKYRIEKVSWRLDSCFLCIMNTFGSVLIWVEWLFCYRQIPPSACYKLYNFIQIPHSFNLQIIQPKKQADMFLLVLLDKQWARAWSWGKNQVSFVLCFFIFPSAMLLVEETHFPPPNVQSHFTLLL